MNPKTYEEIKESLVIKWRTVGLTGREIIELAELNHMKVSSLMSTTFSKKVDLVGIGTIQSKQISPTIMCYALRFIEAVKKKAQV